VARQAHGHDWNAEKLALEFHRQAARIDSLPRFFLFAGAVTQPFRTVAMPSSEPLENLIRVLDVAIDEKDSYQHQRTFAWDQQRVLDKTDESRNPYGTPQSFFAVWGTPFLAGSVHQIGDQSTSYTLRSSAKAMWRSHGLTSPVYLRVTTHKFWWGDNCYPDQAFSIVPPELAEYRHLKVEEFDGDLCDVVESSPRRERLWFSRNTARLRGYLQLSDRGPFDNLLKSKTIANIAGKEFKSWGDYFDWRRRKFVFLSRDDQLRLTLAEHAARDFSMTQPSLIVRFRDYREIIPGVWWPFQEDAAEGLQMPDGFRYKVSTFRVQEIRTGVDLGETIDELEPKEGQSVVDERFVFPFYNQSESKVEAYQHIELADVDAHERLRAERIVAKIRQPFEQLVGKPAPAFPPGTWVGGPRPNLEGQPYLVYFWAGWYGPSHDELRELRQMSKDGYIIIGFHAKGSDASTVERVQKDTNLGQPTFLPFHEEAGLDGSTMGTYAAKVLPYCLVVDAKGIVAGHGSLREESGAIIQLFQRLSQQSNDTSRTQK
jgi:hypothetical protein